MKSSVRTLLFLLLLIGGIGTSAAYRDHRGVRIDSLEALLHSANPPQGEELLGVYLDLMRGYPPVDAARWEMYARKALALSYRLNKLNAREGALYNLGLMAYGRDEFDTALGYYQWALALTDSMRHDKRYSSSTIDDNLSQLYGAIGNLYNMQDQLLLAIEYYQRALPIFERNGWLESQCILYHNVGELYLSMGNNEKAEQNYLLALERGEQAKDSLMMALPRKGLAKIYLGQEYDKARQTLLPAYEYYHAHRAEEPGDYAEILASMARLCLQSDSTERAKAYAEEALTYADAVMTEIRCDAYAAACEVAMAEGHWQQALEYGLQSVHDDDDEATYSDASCYVLLADIYTQLGDKEKARLYINKVYDMMARFATEHYQSGITQMEILYETEKKQAAIEQLTREKRWLTMGAVLSGVVLLLVALLFFLLWRSVRLTRRHALVTAKLEGERTERVRIARDLHDRLGGILTALRMQLSEPTALSLTDDAIREMRNVSHHLLPDSLTRYGLRTALSDYCQTMKNVTFSFMGEEQRIAHEEAIYCIVYELVNNAVKHSGAEHIRVQLVAQRDYTAVNVSDDGKGFAPPGQATADDGSGLQGIRERVAAIGGTMDVFARQGEGTEINIELKINTRNDEQREQ